ncbi:RHS repeat-associated core domain-containing protein [Pseudomonas sp. H11T01]|uniref:RHS repeat-associated core domain-containing protein n=1 Tax=Pseudomonas sp. H11T01 TaxID=3402749 RepID=UPI003AC787C3
MPVSPRETVLCRYHYDPLDRLADCALSAQADIQRFYCKSRLATEIQGAVQTSVFQHDDQLLAQQQRQDAKVNTTLLATDQQRSVLNAIHATQPHPIAYTPYGHRPLGNGLLSLLGFNGERPDPVTGHYHLGNGYRQFNPVLMRFNSPDSWSPFGEGGLNAYGYVGGEPITGRDPTGHAGIWGKLKYIGKILGLRTSARSTTEVTTTMGQKSTSRAGSTSNLLSPNSSSLDEIPKGSKALPDPHGSPPPYSRHASSSSLPADSWGSPPAYKKFENPNLAKKSGPLRSYEEGFNRAIENAKTITIPNNKSFSTKKYKKLTAAQDELNLFYTQDNPTPKQRIQRDNNFIYLSKNAQKIRGAQR